MLAFVKRRWFLLPCLVALLVCSMVDLPITTMENLNSTRMYGVHKGYFFWCENTFPRTAEMIESKTIGASSSWAVYAVKTRSGIRRPMLGEWPWYDYVAATPVSFASTMSPEERSIGVPIWIPLSVVLGWLVIRELRWREQRAKTKEAIAA